MPEPAMPPEPAPLPDPATAALPGRPTLLVAAHGTRSPAGAATTARLVEAVAAARPELPVRLCFLDVAAPRLAHALDDSPGPTVVVPLLLSAGYHVLADIPAVVAGRPQIRVAAHLGPDPRVITALVDRLQAARGELVPRSTLLARVGSSRRESDHDFDRARALLAARVGHPVGELVLGGPAEQVRTQVAALPAPVEIASYLLAEGEFWSRLRAQAGSDAVVAEPIGAHPELVRLVLARYDQATVG